MIQSKGQVELTWPVPAEGHLTDQGPTLADIRTEFERWLFEAKRRGCPDDARVHVVRFSGGPYDLAVIWDAGPPKAEARNPAPLARVDQA